MSNTATNAVISGQYANNNFALRLLYGSIRAIVKQICERGGVDSSGSQSSRVMDEKLTRAAGFTKTVAAGADQIVATVRAPRACAETPVPFFMLAKGMVGLIELGQASGREDDDLAVGAFEGSSKAAALAFRAEEVCRPVAFIGPAFTALMRSARS